MEIDAYAFCPLPGMKFAALVIDAVFFDLGKGRGGIDDDTWI